MSPVRFVLHPHLLDHRLNSLAALLLYCASLRLSASAWASQEYAVAWSLHLQRASANKQLSMVTPAPDIVLFLFLLALLPTPIERPQQQRPPCMPTADRTFGCKLFFYDISFYFFYDISILLIWIKSPQLKNKSVKPGFLSSTGPVIKI